MAAGLLQAAPPDTERQALDYLLGRLAPFKSEGDYYEVGGDLLRLRPSAQGAQFIPSFDLPPDSAVYPVLSKYKRVFVYDLAVEIAALVLAGRRQEATALLLTLQSVQLPDGAFPFSFNAQGDSFMNYSYLRTGTVAWAGYAALLYETETQDRSFHPIAQGVASWLQQRQVPGDRDQDYRAGLLLGGYGQWAPDYTSLAKGERSWACTEHAIDAYFFFRLYATAAENARERGRRLDVAERIRLALMTSLWTQTPDGMGRFYQGIDEQHLNMGKALDCASWGALFLLATGDKPKAEAALRSADKTFATTLVADGAHVRGYRPYAGKNDGINWDRYPDVVWTEGSLGVALAHLRLGRRDRFEAIVGDMLKLCAVPGNAATGLRYSRYQQDLRGNGGGEIGAADFIRDFTRAPSACSTAWLVLVLESAKEVNWSKFWGPL